MDREMKFLTVIFCQLWCVSILDFAVRTTEVDIQNSRSNFCW